MNNKPNKIWFLLFVLLLLINCDTDKFFGYNYDAESLIESTPVSGRITNIFTSVPVTSAKIKIGPYETLTDKDGDYLLVYPLGTDEERDKFIPIIVTAPNYFPDSLETIIEAAYDTAPPEIGNHWYGNKGRGYLGNTQYEHCNCQ